MIPYKQVEELGVTAEEYLALITLTILLEDEEESINLGMNRCCSVESTARHPCNTNACIGGWMAILIASDFELPELVTPDMAQTCTQYVNGGHSPALKNLFWDETDPDTPKEDAVAAIRSFLTGNVEAPWNFPG